MAKYLVLYRAASDSQAQMADMTPEQAQEGMELWMQWAGKAGSSLVDLGAPVASVATVGGGDSKDLAVCGFSILEADSQEAVAKLIEDHPHFHTPGPTAIEVLEFQPIPGS
jgi:hypothetical protein